MRIRELTGIMNSERPQGHFKETGEGAALMHGGRTRRGGALVRMLGPAVCLLIVALLAYGVIDWFDSAKRVGRKSWCQSNLKQLGAGLAMYIEDYDGKLPPAQKWQDGTFPYVKSSEIYICPARPDTKPGYAFNQRLDGMNSRKASKPAQTPVLFESSRGQRNGTDQLTSFTTPHERPSGNICFLDGHVKAFTVPPSADVPLKKDAQ